MKEIDADIAMVVGEKLYCPTYSSMGSPINYQLGMAIRDENDLFMDVTNAVRSTL